MDLIGIQCSDEEIKSAVELSSVSNMKESEKKFKTGKVNPESNSDFVRKGKTDYGGGLSEKEKSIVTNLLTKHDLDWLAKHGIK